VNCPETIDASYCVAGFVTVKLASSVNSIVTDLLKALLSNGSVNKPQHILFSMRSAPRPLLSDGSVNTF
jgi:hypothetical protein